MPQVLQTQPDQVSYIDTNGGNALNEFEEAFYDVLQQQYRPSRPIVVVCIGSDRATGDALGPITGHKLLESTHTLPEIHIYGTLAMPVHAKNLCATLEVIAHRHKEPLVIAVDACLGRRNHIGFLTVGEGSVTPGAGVNKMLPAVGDIFITGIVNFSGSMDFFVLQNTRLSIVMKMADIICSGLLCSFLRIRSASPSLHDSPNFSSL